MRYIAKISTVRVKQHINTGFIPPSASKTDLWPLPGKAARDSGYSKARLGHSLLIKIFFKLDCLITWTYPDLPSFGLLRNQNSQVLGQVSSPKRPIWWDSSANRSLKGGSPYNFSLETVLPNYIHFYTDYQCTSPRCSILGSSVFTPRKYEWHQQREQTIVPCGKKQTSFHEYLTETHCLSVFGTTGPSYLPVFWNMSCEDDQNAFPFDFHCHYCLKLPIKQSWIQMTLFMPSFLRNKFKVSLTVRTWEV